MNTAIYTLNGELLAEAGGNLREATLYGADLRGADLYGVAPVMGILLDDSLPRKVLEQITREPDSWDQGVWHNSCGTRHCVAGWTVVLAGPLGHFLEAQWGTAVAATLLLWREGLSMPSFSGTATEDEVLGPLRRMAEALPPPAA